MAFKKCAVKRKRVTLSIVDKLKVIEKIEAGVPVTQIMEECGIAKQTVSDIRRNKEKLLQYSIKYHSSPNELLTRKTIRPPQDPDLQEAVYKWYLEQRSVGVPIGGAEIKAAAEIFSKSLNIPDFTASSGWLWRFLKRHNISRKSVCLSRLEVIKSNKGHHKVIHLGFMYTKHKAMGDKIRWRCVQRVSHCKGSIFTATDFTNPRVTVNHNHIPDMSAVEFARCRTMIAERVNRLRVTRPVIRVAVEENPNDYRNKKEALDPGSSTGMMPLPGPSSAPSVSADNFLQSLDLYQSNVPQHKSRRSMRPLQDWPVPQQGAVAGQKPVVPPPPPAPPQPPTLKKQQPQSVPPSKPPAPRPVSPPQPPPPPPEVCLRWNSYHSNMQATFPSLLNNEQFVDVTLACEGRSIKCHKMMLSACSAYFEELLSQNPCQHPIVLMKDLRYWEVQALVDFMYRGEVNVGQDKLPSLLAAAEALQIKGLAGPASTSSSHDEDSLPPSLPLGSAEDYMDESTPSPSSARRARKRRVMASLPAPQPQPPPPPQPVPVPVPRNPVGRPRLSRTSAPVASTSSYHQDSSSLLPSEPPIRRPRKNDTNDIVGEIKIEPIDIEDNDSMDHVDNSYMDKAYDRSGAAGDGESNGQVDDGGGNGEPSGSMLGDHKTIIHRQDPDQGDYGNNNGMASDSSGVPNTAGHDTELQGYRYENSRNRDSGITSGPDITGAAYPEVIMNPPGGSGSGTSSSDNLTDSILGHM